MLIRSLRPGLPPDRISKELRGGCVRKGCRCSNREIFSDSTVRSLTRTRFRDHAHSNHNITASTQLHPCLQARTLERWFVTVCVSRCVTVTRRADAHSAALQPLALRLEPLRLPFTTPPESPFESRCVLLGRHVLSVSSLLSTHLSDGYNIHALPSFAP